MTKALRVVFMSPPPGMRDCLVKLEVVWLTASLETAVFPPSGHAVGAVHHASMVFAAPAGPPRRAVCVDGSAAVRR